jgi:hypothetical protein
MMDWTDESGLAVWDQLVANSMYRQVAPMSHHVFLQFHPEIGIATPVRSLSPATCNFAETHQF